MASSKAFDGFFAISGILGLAMFLLLIQLCLIHFKEGDKEWRKIVQGNKSFPTIVSRSSSKSVVHEKEGFFADMKLRFDKYGLENLQPKLNRKTHQYKYAVVYLDLAIVLGGCIIWIPMLIAICQGKLEILFSKWRGAVLIVVALFFILCGTASGIISIMSIYTADINDYYDTQSKALKFVADVIKNNPDKSISDPETLDTIKDGKVYLTPSTWMLILFDCLGAGGYTMNEIMENKKIDESDIPLIYEVAITRLANSQPLTKIRGKSYNMWMLQQLHLCPHESVKQSLQGFLAILLCWSPFVPWLLWKEYGRKPEGPKKRKEDKDKETVIGTNVQLSTIVNPPEPEPLLESAMKK